MILKVEAEKRELGKKSELSQLRRNGFIPAIIYADGKAGQNISLLKRDFMKTYKKSIGELAFFSITLEGKEYLTILKERQIHPVSRDLTHVDFQELRQDKMINIHLPLKYIGTPVGVKEGGVVDITVRTLDIQCLPKDVVEDYEVDITNLKVGQSIHIKDIKIPNLQIKSAQDLSIVSVHPPKGEKVSKTATETAE